MPARPSESQECVAARIESWVETYKQSMLTPVILDLVAAHQSASIAEVADGIAATTGRQITERDLYRTLKRLQDFRPARQHRRRRSAHRRHTQGALAHLAGRRATSCSSGGPTGWGDGPGLYGRDCGRR